jgi:hypothetical protein
VRQARRLVEAVVLWLLLPIAVIYTLVAVLAFLGAATRIPRGGGNVFQWAVLIGLTIAIFAALPGLWWVIEWATQPAKTIWRQRTRAIILRSAILLPIGLIVGATLTIRMPYLRRSISGFSGL